MNYKVGKKEREKRNKGIVQDYKANKLSLVEIAKKYNVSHSTVDKVVSSAGLSKEERRGVTKDDTSRFHYEYKTIDKKIMQVTIASGDIRYQVSGKGTTRRFKTFQEAEDFVSNQQILEKDIDLSEYPLNVLEKIFITVKFDDMGYVINHFEENFNALCDKLFDDKQKEIVDLRFKQGYTLESIGKKYGLTKERVRQLEDVILKRLRYSRMSYDYLNKGYKATDLYKDIDLLTQELEIRKKALEEKIEKMEKENSLTPEEMTKINMSKDSIAKYTLGLKTRTINVFRRNGFSNVKQIVDYVESKGGYEALLELRGFGVDCVKDCKTMLKRVYKYTYHK